MLITALSLLILALPAYLVSMIFILGFSIETRDATTRLHEGISSNSHQR